MVRGLWFLLFKMYDTSCFLAALHVAMVAAGLLAEWVWRQRWNRAVVPLSVPLPECRCETVRFALQVHAPPLCGMPRRGP